MNFSIQFEPNLSPEDNETIYQGLLAHNVEDIGLPLSKIRTQNFAFVVRIDGQIRAGLIGNIKYHAAFIDTLWVDKSLRRQGLGQSLIKKAEEHAINHGCLVVFLNTLTLKNVQFYEKQGYVFEFARKDFLGLAGHTMRYFRKDISKS